MGGLKKIPSEGGSGGGRGHSGMEHWAHTDEIKEAARARRRSDDRSASQGENDDELSGVELRVLATFAITGRGTGAVVDIQLESWPYGGARHVSIEAPNAPVFRAIANLELILKWKGEIAERPALVLQDVQPEHVPVGTIIRIEDAV